MVRILRIILVRIVGIVVWIIRVVWIRIRIQVIAHTGLTVSIEVEVVVTNAGSVRVAASVHKVRATVPVVVARPSDTSSTRDLIAKIADALSGRDGTLGVTTESKTFIVGAAALLKRLALNILLAAGKSGRLNQSEDYKK